MPFVLPGMLAVAVAYVDVAEGEVWVPWQKREDLHDAVEVAAYLEGASARSVRPGNVLYQWLFENWTQTRGVAFALLALFLMVIVLLALAV